MVRVDVRPALLTWAMDRAGTSVPVLARRFPKLQAWIDQTSSPTLRQLEAFANATFTSVGYLLLDTPPADTLPIPDFRTVADRRVSRPSPHLLDTVYLCQQRQDWYREAARVEGARPLPFVGSARVGDDVSETAARIRSAVGFNLEERRSMPTWSDALRRFIQQVDASGILVMVSGIVGSNSRRRLRPEEFRGFALADDVAPLIFLNGADSKAAQMFTLAHELAHIWLGESAVSDATLLSTSGHRVEQWCNLVAAELLVPMTALEALVTGYVKVPEVSQLARTFKVSTLVILRRLHDVGALSREAYWDAYNAEVARLRSLPAQSGGEFYLSLGARASKTFSRALVASTLEGTTSFTEAFRLLGVRKTDTFYEAARHLGLKA